MDDSNYSRNRQNDNLGVNKIGKNIRKDSLLHQPNFANNTRQQPQPQIYNIDKNNFRDVVQQLTGSPLREPLPRPPQNLPKPSSLRLQRIRPPPLTPMNRPQLPIYPPAPAQAPPAVVPYNDNFSRPAQFGHHSPAMLRPLTPGDSGWRNTAESPISAYMRYLQNSVLNSGSTPTQDQPQYQPQTQVPGQFHAQPPAHGLLPNPPMPPLQSPRMNGPPSLLPSPTSQFLLPSPNGFLNVFPPRSPNPMLSPRYQFPPPWTPNFSFSPMAQSGILGPGPQPPPSPGTAFPLSPSFFSFPSPRWRD